VSTTTGLPPNVAEYLDALRAELADLAPEERDDLLSEVEPSLLEAAVPVADELVEAQSLQFPAGAYYGALTAPPPQPPAGLSYDGVAIDNVYPYDRAGRPLYDVRLYDSFGKPLDWGRNFENEDRRMVRDADGATVFNSFPIRYYVPGTKRVANPQAAPPLATPRLTTPPLVPSAERP
jgi:hypothetical protein